MNDINVVNTVFNGTYFDRPITPEQYERAQDNRGYLTDEDKKTVLTESERYGYGASAGSVYETGGKYYVRCHRYNNCD